MTGLVQLPDPDRAMRSRDTDIVIIPGFGGSGSDHWQSRWQARLPNVRRVEQSDWNHADRNAWVERIADTIRGCERPVVAVAHSLGVIALAHAVAEGLPAPAGGFLVAPPAGRSIREIASIDPTFVPVPDTRLGFPTLLVGSRDDPYATFEETASLAEAWGATLIDAGNSGHINPDSGHGPWPEGLMAFGGFLNRLSGPAPRA